MQANGPVFPAPLRVLMTSTSFPFSLADWRGLFMRHLADALARREDLELFLWAPPGDAHPRITRVTTPHETAELGTLMQEGGIAHLLRTQRYRGLVSAVHLLTGLRRVFSSHVSDIYHVNWLQCALPLPQNRKPALITVLGNDLKLLRLPLMKTLLRRSMRNRRVAICPNADWMVGELRASFGDLANVVAVAFGIDPRWYAVARELRDDEAADWLVVSRVTRDKIGPLFEWCEPLFADGRRKLHLFGPMQETMAIPDWVTFHGPATPDDLRERWFVRAHGLITLSQHAEGRPQVMLEAMASGLPIVASRMPAHESLLEHAVTGWLVGDPGELRFALEALGAQDENRRIGEAARRRILSDVGTWDDCAQRFVSIYRELLGTAG